ncbi:MAG: sulfite exporter TauE/SafE family protein [Ottowia sp.]|nr:sulfite exporter TauE/SafE family protein [Ottowia sp.]
MPIDVQIIVELTVLGLFVGFAAGLFGIGGGGTMVPLIAAILSTRGVSGGLAVKMAIATSMATIVFTATSSVWAHHRRGAVRWDLVASLAPGIVAGSILASFGAFAVLKGWVLALIFGVFLMVAGTRMFSSKPASPRRHLPGPTGLFGAGGVIGFLSGLVGIGGGAISVPFLAWCNVTVHHAVATSAALGLPIAVSNMAGYIYSGHGVTGLPPYSFGYIWLPALVIIAVCSVSMAPLGARISHRLPVARLRRLFALLLYGLGIYMLYKGFSTMGT